jgi:lysophospholipase L1-like esterase
VLTTRQKALALATVAFVSIVVALGVTEVGLRLAHFEFQPFPVVQFGWPDPVPLQRVYTSDPDLLWVTKDYGGVIARAHRERPAIVFMGDSCTQFGTYPSKTLQLLASERPSLRQGVKVGVGGWTVMQGEWQLTRDVLPLRPRVVTIYYGWNDHWMALGPPDAEVRRAPVLTWLSDHFRLVQLIAKIRAGWLGRSEERPNRVDLPLYESTLVRMVQQIHGAGAQAVLITAASNHTVGAEPGYLKVRHLRRLSDLVPMHQAYVNATRRAAHESGAILCDAAAHFAALPQPHAPYFKRDGIHLTETGDRELAPMVAKCIEAADDSRQQFR